MNNSGSEGGRLGRALVWIHSADETMRSWRPPPYDHFLYISFPFPTMARIVVSNIPSTLRERELDDICKS